MSSLFVLGGARSGKSRYAQNRAEATGLAQIYIATAEAWDDEMRERIRLHQQDRGPAWNTHEAPIALAETIRAHKAAGTVLLVDCLTLWVTNLLLGGHNVSVATDDLADAIVGVAGKVVLVSNEVGLGIVPENALARRFRDEAGWVNQRVARIADEVQFIVAGLNSRLK